jgi:predicted RNA-binding Zn-ribbon protein involved in translation (DUF1610 family)
MAKKQTVELYEHDDDMCSRGCGRGCSRNQYHIGFSEGRAQMEEAEVKPLEAQVKTLESVIEDTPIQMLLWCPECGERHIDRDAFATKKHHTHACQSCGMTWRPAVAYTVGVQFLPGFKNPER